MKRFLFLAPFALALSVSAANVKISDLALVSTPSTNTFQEIADLNAIGTNKSARVFLAWTSVGESLRPLLPATNYFFGADIFASGTNNGQNITLIGNRAAYQAIFDSATHDVFGAGFYPFRASVLQGASDVSAIGQNSLATSYLTNSADVHAWGNYALFGISATNSSNIYGKGHSAGQGAIVTASGNLFFDGNETGLGSYFTNVTDMSLFNGAIKNATISDSHNFGAFGIDALSGYNGSLNNLFYFGTNIDVYIHGGLAVANTGASVAGMVPVYTDTTGTKVTPTNTVNFASAFFTQLIVSNLNTGWVYYNGVLTNAPYTPVNQAGDTMTGSLTTTGGLVNTNTATTQVGLDIRGFAGQTNDIARVSSGGTNYWTVDKAGNFLAGIDNANNIGASTSANRPKSLFLGTSLAIGGNVTVDTTSFQAHPAGQFRWNTRSVVSSPADGDVELSNAALNNFGKLQFGGATASFPAIKRNGPALNVRLADDSGDGVLTYLDQINVGSAVTLSTTNRFYLVNVDAQTITLPTAAGAAGKTYSIKTISPAATATIATTSSQLIDGASTFSLSASNKFVRVTSDGTNWWIFGSN